MRLRRLVARVLYRIANRIYPPTPPTLFATEDGKPIWQRVAEDLQAHEAGK